MTRTIVQIAASGNTMTRTIVQIAASGNTLYALCNDGSLWMLTMNIWVQVATIPNA